MSGVGLRQGTDAAIIVTYRCNAKCKMCNTWQYPTKPSEEITLETIRKLPSGIGRCNITGGEPMLRQDIAEIVEVLRQKAERVEISTNGYFTDRIVALAERFPDLTIRVSLDGMPPTNDAIRGIPKGFEHGFRTIERLKQMGLKDIGFAIVIQDDNASDLLEFFKMTQDMGVEFAQAVPHNSFYFHKFDNEIRDKPTVSREVERLIAGFLKSRRPKNWFRAYLNKGLADHILEKPRRLPCTAGTDIFFLDPFGEIYPCNAMEESLGNLNNQDFETIWSGERADDIRQMVAGCSRNCWMTGTAVPAMKKNLAGCAWWVARNKIRVHMGKDALLD